MTTALGIWCGWKPYFLRQRWKGKGQGEEAVFQHERRDRVITDKFSWIYGSGLTAGDRDKKKSFPGTQVIHCIWPCSLGNRWRTGGCGCGQAYTPQSQDAIWMRSKMFTGIFAE